MDARNFRNFKCFFDAERALPRGNVADATPWLREM
jgi:hypothetical protein